MPRWFRKLSMRPRLRSVLVCLRGRRASWRCGSITLCRQDESQDICSHTIKYSPYRGRRAEKNHDMSTCRSLQMPWPPQTPRLLRQRRHEADGTAGRPSIALLAGQRYTGPVSLQRAMVQRSHHTSEIVGPTLLVSIASKRDMEARTQACLTNVLDCPNTSQPLATWQPCPGILTSVGSHVTRLIQS